MENINNEVFKAEENILLSILPSIAWTEIFKKLEKKHPSSLENLSNSSPYFRKQLLSKRVISLFTQVFNLIETQYPNQTNAISEGSNLIRSRLVCKDWNKAIDHFIIDPTLEPDFFNTEPPQPSDHPLFKAKYQYFGNEAPTKLPNFLTHFEPSHLPKCSRNPFIGKVVYINLNSFRDETQWVQIAEQVSTLLRKYGHHIKILNLSLFKYKKDLDIQLQRNGWLRGWLENCPNLTHLKVSERNNLKWEIDGAFGDFPNNGRTMESHGSELQPINVNYFGQRQRIPGCHWVRNRTGAGDQLSVFHNMQRLMEPLLQPLQPVQQQPIGHRHRHNLNANQLRGPRPVVEPVPPVVPPFPTLKYLKCLKLYQLSALNFNSLLVANTQVTWLEIDALNEEKDKYVDYQALKFPNLTKLRIKLCSPEEVKKLRSIHPSWLSLTQLHFEYCTSTACCSAPFTNWVEIFRAIIHNWGITLQDLKLRLPIPETKQEREKVAEDSRDGRLNLPNLKRLKIWLGEKPGEEGLVKIDFLKLIKDRLEELSIN